MCEEHLLVSSDALKIYVLGKCALAYLSFCVAVRDFLSCTVVDLGAAFMRKSELECELPTAPTNLLTTDQCLTKSLNGINLSLAKVLQISYIVT